MRVEQLSSYGADQVNVSRRRAQEAESKRREVEVEQMETEARLVQARRSKSLWRKIFGRMTEEERAARTEHETTTQQVQQAAYHQDQAQIRTKQRETGEHGEQELSEALARHLGDEWMMFRGYMSKKGEADAVLVGPQGVWVIEVKTRRVRLHVDGENWNCQKLSRSGRAYEWERAVDGGRRAWGRQASDAAGALGRWLDRNERSAPIRTAVVLMAPGAEVAACQDPGVDLVTVGTAELENAIQNNPVSVERRLGEDIENLIRRDHRHSMERRRPS